MRAIFLGNSPVSVSVSKKMADERAEDNAVVSGQPQKTIADFDPPGKPKRNKYAFACAILASMTSILLGYGKYA